VISKGDGLSGKFYKYWNYQGNFNFFSRSVGLEIVGKRVYTPASVDFLMILVIYALVHRMKSAAIGRNFQDHCLTGLIYISMFLELPTKIWLIYGMGNLQQLFGSELKQHGQSKGRDLPLMVFMPTQLWQHVTFASFARLTTQGKSYWKWSLTSLVCQHAVIAIFLKWHEQLLIWLARKTFSRDIWQRRFSIGGWIGK